MDDKDKQQQQVGYSEYRLRDGESYVSDAGSIG